VKEFAFYSETIAKNWDVFMMRNDDAWFWHNEKMNKFRDLHINYK